MKSSRLICVLSLLIMLASTGCVTEHKKHRHMWSGIKQAIAVVQPTSGNSCQGTVQFTQDGNSVQVVAEIHGLTPNAQHAIHIHQFGDATAPDGKSAGGHYNPENHDHALPGALFRHAGDLGNLAADASGHAYYELKVDNISIAGLKNPIIGRGVIVHAKADDGGQPTGNAGPRIGCGIIGIAKPME